MIVSLDMVEINATVAYLHRYVQLKLLVMIRYLLTCFHFIVLILSCSSCQNENVTVVGKLCYPSDYIPAMTVYLKNIESGKEIKQSTSENQSYFRFENISLGKYNAYAYTVDETITDTAGRKSMGSGGYTKAVLCGLTIHCNDHTLITFEVNQSSQKDTIAICDWYNAEIPVEE